MANYHQRCATPGLRAQTGETKDDSDDETGVEFIKTCSGGSTTGTVSTGRMRYSPVEKKDTGKKDKDKNDGVELLALTY